MARDNYTLFIYIVKMKEWENSGGENKNNFIIQWQLNIQIICNLQDI